MMILSISTIADRTLGGAHRVNVYIHTFIEGVSMCMFMIVCVHILCLQKKLLFSFNQETMLSFLELSSPEVNCKFKLECESLNHQVPNKVVYSYLSPFQQQYQLYESSLNKRTSSMMKLPGRIVQKKNFQYASSLKY